MNKENFETENRKKYGNKENDEIAKSFKISLEIGAAACFMPIRKYLTRFVSISEKRQNPGDIEKIKDYCIRLYEKNVISKHDLSELGLFFNNQNYLAAYNYVSIIEIKFFNKITQLKEAKELILNLENELLEEYKNPLKIYFICSEINRKVAIICKPFNQKKENVLIDNYCFANNLIFEDFNNKSRKKEHIIPRQALQYVLHKVFKLSTSKTGLLTGGFDHSTITINCQKVIDQPKTYNQYLKYLENEKTATDL